jgi:signal transduction histidine kinase/CheY-like chemotaxis protein
MLALTTNTRLFEKDIETKLLYAAYSQVGINIGLTLISTLIFVPLMWAHFPHTPLTIWTASVATNLIISYLVYTLFQRAQPTGDALNRWKTLLIIISIIAGAAWAIGPLLMIPHATSSQLAMFLGTLLTVCGIISHTMSEERAAMQIYIIVALVPPALMLWHYGDKVIQLVALLLFSSAILLILVGRNMHQISRNRFKTELEAITARQIADHANQAKSNFLSSMSHELRTPMNAILGFSQIMAHDATLSATHKDHIQEILKGGDHLLALINDVLDLAKIESGHLNLKPEPISIAAIVADCLKLIQPLATTKQVKLHVITPAAIYAHADYVRLKQVLLNLLSNAVKYNREAGDIRLNVSTSAKNRLRITISDTGDGIAPKSLATIFQPFMRLEQHAKIEGTGIGLSITRRLVNLMHGEVGVESQVGVGSTFWIDLPSAHKTAPQITAIEKIPPRALPPPGPMRQRRVLYIDDTPVNLKLVSQLLKHHRGINITTCVTPESGIQQVKAEPPELILLDIAMPGMDGYDVLKAIKAHEHLSSIPIIAVTANAMPQDIERGYAAGFTAYLTKPINIPQLLETVDNCLSN